MSDPFGNRIFHASLSGMELSSAFKSWKIDLRSRNLSVRTIETYKLAVVQLIDWLGDRDVTEITPNDIRQFIGYMLDTRSAATAKQRYSSLNVLFGWLLIEGEIEVSPMSKVTKPRVTEKPVPVISERAFDLVLATCDSSFLGKRDEALLRLTWDSGIRVSELVGIRIEDVSLDLGIVWVDGKTGERQVPFSLATTRGLDRYIRIRSKHRNASDPHLWLSDRGKGVFLTRSGAYRMVSRRSDIAKVGHQHPHVFRHTMAHRFLAAGMAEGSVMQIGGWSDRKMLDRYGRSARSQRAIEDFRRLFD